jgi:hypothetical protein
MNSHYCFKYYEQKTFSKSSAFLVTHVHPNEGTGKGVIVLQADVENLAQSKVLGKGRGRLSHHMFWKEGNCRMGWKF